MSAAPSYPAPRVDVETQLRQRARRGPGDGPAGIQHVEHGLMARTIQFERSLPVDRDGTTRVRADLRICDVARLNPSAPRRVHIGGVFGQADQEGGCLGRIDGALGKDGLDATDCEVVHVHRLAVGVHEPRARFPRRARTRGAPLEGQKRDDGE
jgi:hypothetical protein